jgi:hypothetical protein
LLKISICRCDDANINLAGGFFADTFKLTNLQDAQ